MRTKIWYRAWESMAASLLIIAVMSSVVSSSAKGQTTTDVVVTSSGDLRVGAGSPGGKLEITNADGNAVNRFLASNSGNVLITSDGSNTANAQIWMRYYDGATDAHINLATFKNKTIVLSVLGEAEATEFNDTSSRRWKQDITPLETGIDRIMQLRSVTYRWNALAATELGIRSDERRKIGLIAEEVAEVVPEAVSFDEEGGQARAIAYGKLVPVLIKAVQEQQGEIEALKAELAQLKEGS